MHLCVHVYVCMTVRVSLCVYVFMGIYVSIHPTLGTLLFLLPQK